MKPFVIAPRWARQPGFGAELDTEHPLAKNAEFVVIPTNHLELVRRTTPTVTASAARQIGRGGLAWNFPGSGNLSLGTPATAVGLAGRHATWVGVFTATAISTTLLAERNDNNNDSGWKFGYSSAASGGLGLVKVCASLNLTAIASGAVPTAGINTLVVTHDGSDTAANVRVYLNGVLQTLTTANNGSGTHASDSADTLFVGKSTFGPIASHNGDIYLVGAFGRIWSPADVAAFHMNPWAMFLPRWTRPSAVQAAAAFTMTAAQGSYALTGQSNNLLRGRRLDAVQGTYALTGQATALSKGYPMAAAQGSYILTGQDVGLRAARAIAAAQGAYALSGQAANLLFGHQLAAAAGSYSLGGQAVNLLRASRIVLAQGSYTLTGVAAGLRAARLVLAEAGAYTLPGQSAGLLRGRLLTAAQGSYALAGQSVTLSHTDTGITMPAAAGSYTLTGQALAFTYVPHVTGPSGGTYTPRASGERRAAAPGESRGGAAGESRHGGRESVRPRGSRERRR